MTDFMSKALKQAKPMMVGIVGMAIVLTGIVMIALPGPGLLIILAGLAILATEFMWARTLLARVKSIIGRIRKGRTP